MCIRHGDLTPRPPSTACHHFQDTYYEPAITLLGVINPEAEPATIYPDSTVPAGTAVRVQYTGMATTVIWDSTVAVPASAVAGGVKWFVADNITAAYPCPLVDAAYVCAFMPTPFASDIRTTVWLFFTVARSQLGLLPPFNWTATWLSFQSLPLVPLLAPPIFLIGNC